MSDFDDLIRRIEQEAEAAGPEAVKELQALREYYRDKHLRQARAVVMKHRERQADADIAAGRVKQFDSAEEFLEDLDQ